MAYSWAMVQWAAAKTTKQANSLEIIFMPISPQHIIQALESQNFDKAIDLCHKLRKTGVQHPQLFLFLALAHGRKGDLNTAEKWFDELSRRIGENAEVHYNRGVLYQENGQFDQACQAYERCLALNPHHAAALNNLGLIKSEQEQFEYAIECLEKALHLQPDNLDYRRNLANVLQTTHAFSEASPHWRILTQAPQPLLEDWLGLIKAQAVLIQLKEATTTAEQALEYYPDEPKLLLWLGRLCIDRRKYAKAITHLETCLQKRPHMAEAIKELTSAYSYGGQRKKASALFPVILQEDTPQAYAFVIELQEMSGQSASAKATLREAKSKWPDNLEITLQEAKHLRHQKAHIDALKVLSTAQQIAAKKPEPDPALLADIDYEKGHNADKLKDFSAAWDAFYRANQQMGIIWRKVSPQKDKFIQRAQAIAQSFNACPTQTTQAEKQDKPADSPHKLVFVVGFPRSGTTLIDNILAAHPDVSVLEEAQILNEVYESIENISAINYAERLQQLNHKEKQQLRKLYFDLLPDYIAGKIRPTVVDKSPMNALHAGLVHTLFPEAKIIFAQRHPADVILSCFMQNFQLNSFMTNLLDINQAAHTYNALLSAWESATTSWQIPYHTVVYEKLVSDFEPQARELITQSGLPWHDDVLRYHQKTVQRGTITTPSFNQANQPVYTASRYRHRHYLAYMREALQILQPWVEKLGYAAASEHSVSHG